MSITLKIRTNPAPCKHTVVTVTEGDEVREMVFHDTDFDNTDFVPDENSRDIYKIIKENLKVTGKKLSEAKADFDGKTVTTIIEKEAVKL